VWGSHTVFFFFFQTEFLFVSFSLLYFPKTASHILEYVWRGRFTDSSDKGRSWLAQFSSYLHLHCRMINLCTSGVAILCSNKWIASVTSLPTLTAAQ
jgi:hypothetical protein